MYYLINVHFLCSYVEKNDLSSISFREGECVYMMCGWGESRRVLLCDVREDIREDFIYVYDKFSDSFFVVHHNIYFYTSPLFPLFDNGDRYVECSCNVFLSLIKICFRIKQQEPGFTCPRHIDSISKRELL